MYLKIIDNLIDQFNIGGLSVKLKKHKVFLSIWPSMSLYTWEKNKPQKYMQ